MRQPNDHSSTLCCQEIPVSKRLLSDDTVPIDEGA